jgi:hypothetical protein
MTDEKPPLTDEQVKEIAARRAASLKRIQDMHQKANASPSGKSGKSPKPPPPKGRPFRHQGR